MLEPYAEKFARAVLREERGREAPDLPGAENNMRLPTRKLINEMMNDFPKFEPVEDYKRGYLFAWASEAGMDHYIVISSSQKNLCYEVDLSSTILGQFDNRYGGNLARGLCRLPNLREQSNALSQQQAYYYHDGTVEVAKEALNKIAYEIKKYALPWFEHNQSNISNGSILQYGTEWIKKNIDRIPLNIEQQLEEALNRVNYSTIRVEHQLLDELKSCLREYASTIDTSKDDRQKIVTLGIDLLMYGKYLKTAANREQMNK